MLNCTTTIDFKVRNEPVMKRVVQSTNGLAIIAAGNDGKELTRENDNAPSPPLIWPGSSFMGRGVSQTKLH